MADAEAIKNVVEAVHPTTANSGARVHMRRFTPMMRRGPLPMLPTGAAPPTFASATPRKTPTAAPR